MEPSVSAHVGARPSVLLQVKPAHAALAPHDALPRSPAAQVLGHAPPADTSTCSHACLLKEGKNLQPTAPTAPAAHTCSRRATSRAAMMQYKLAEAYCWSPESRASSPLRAGVAGASGLSVHWRQAGSAGSLWRSGMADMLCCAAIPFLSFSWLKSAVTSPLPMEHGCPHGSLACLARRPAPCSPSHPRSPHCTLPSCS